MNSECSVLYTAQKRLCLKELLAWKLVLGSLGRMGMFIPSVRCLMLIWPLLYKNILFWLNKPLFPPEKMCMLTSSRNATAVFFWSVGNLHVLIFLLVPLNSQDIGAEVIKGQCSPQSPSSQWVSSLLDVSQQIWKENKCYQIHLLYIIVQTIEMTTLASGWYGENHSSLIPYLKHSHSLLSRISVIFVFY